MRGMSDAIKTVRLITNVADNRCRHVNVLTSAPSPNKNTQPTHAQATGAAAHNEYPEYYVAASGAGPFTNGLLTIAVPGFSAPS